MEEQFAGTSEPTPAPASGLAAPEVFELAKIDGRFRAWRFRRDVARDIRECAKSLSEAYVLLLDTNPKTGSLLVQGQTVRQNVARNAANVFLDFLFDVVEGKAVSMNGLNPRIVRLVAAKYAVEGATWTDLVEGTDA